MRVTLRRILILTVFCALPVHAGGPRHWLKTHKGPVAAFVVATSVQAGNAASTRYAERRCGSCVDMGFFGPRPTDAQVWFGTELFAASMLAINLLAYRFAPDTGGKYFMLALTTVPLLVSGGADISDNLNAPRTVAARQRVMRDEKSSR